MPRLPRAWRGIAAIVLSLMFVPMALADQAAPNAAPATSTAPVAPDTA
ncbi:tonB-system energizer ExbB, partial [Pseudomonas syringae pv. tagetis]